jgi:hypothetical protein
MVRASNIRVTEHLADFRCDTCDTVVTDVNVNTLAYANDLVGEHIGIVVQCTKLSCGQTSFYPLVGGGTISQQLASAKTA